MLDPFMLFKLPLMAFRYWRRKIGLRWIIVGWILSIFGILLYVFLTEA